MRRNITGYYIAFVLGLLSWNSFKWISAAFAAAGYILIPNKEIREKTELFLKRAHIFLFLAGMLVCGAADLSYDMSEVYLASEGKGGRSEVGDPVKSDREKTEDHGRLVVTDLVKSDGEKTVYDCRLRAEKGISINRAVRLRLSIYNRVEDPAAYIGSEIKANIKPERADSAGNPGGFDYNRYLRGKGIYLVASARSIETVATFRDPKNTIKRWIIRKKISYMESIQAPEEVRGIINGILFGDTTYIDEDLYDDFRHNGTAHILAVSGLHVGILYSILRKLFGKGRTGSAVTLVILIIYGTMTLWAVSVTRAMLMIVTNMAADILERRYDTLCSLAMVAFLLTLQHPYCIYSAGFQMSFIAICSMSFLGEKLARKMGKKMGRTTAYVMAVQLGTIPYLAYTFNYVPLGAILINIPVVYILSMTLPVAMTSFLAYTLTGRMLLLDKVTSLLSRWLVDINNIFGNFTILHPDVVSPPLFLIVFVYVAGAYLCSETFYIRHKRGMGRRFLPVVAAGLICVLCSAVFANDFRKADIVMVDVGQGDAMHFRYDKGFLFRRSSANVLIDGGGSESYNVGKKTLKPYFLKNGVRRVDLAYATHLHTDHFKGLEELDKEKMIKTLMTKGRTGVTIYPNGKEDSDNRIEIIYPDVQEPDTDDENKNSLIFKVHIRGITCLITGDLGEEGEKALVQKYKGTHVLDCDILKVSHHGSKYSSCPEFIEAVSPEIALIGVGKNNTYGHPSDEAIKRLESAGARVYRTDTSGAVGIEIGKRGIIVNTVRRKRSYIPASDYPEIN